MLSTLLVTTTSDNGNNVTPLAGSLRAAIVHANSAPAGTYATIDFQIAGSGLHTIFLEAGLPEIVNPVNIDGTSQTGYSNKPLIELDGSMAGPGAGGLDLETTASGTASVPTQVKGLEINDFNGDGVAVNASYVQLSKDYIGVTQIRTNYRVKANGVAGVQFLNGASHDTLSGSTVAGTTGFGVVIAGSGTSYDTLSGDDIGTDPTGLSSLDLNGFSLGNTSNGVIIEAGASHNTVSNSVIVNNGAQGVLISDVGTSFNTLTGNHIGTDKNGAYALPNHLHGVLITASASNNTVGGTKASACNIISGNTDNGIAFSVNDNHNTVQGNYIGVNGAGTAPLPNGANGVFFSGSSTDTVGGTSAGARNVISGNAGYGVWITGGSTKVVVDGDFIGTDATGAYSVPNYYGVVIDGGSTSNTVGGMKASARDVISGNSTWGVYISDSGTSQNVVEGDYIGTDATGTKALPNGYNGLDIVYGATSNTVGGTKAGACNVISGNAYNGVLLGFSGTSTNVVEGNHIGTNATGTAALPNGADGVQIIGGASGNTIGGTVSGSRNVISGNAAAGLYLSDSGTNSNVIEGNYIGTDATGMHAVPNSIGVQVLGGASSNAVGTALTGARNVISGNTSNGVQITGSGTTSNMVWGDYIGVNAAGTAALGNGGSGVAIFGQATYEVIGGTTPFLWNTISGNGLDGVSISDSGTGFNNVDGNYIGTDPTGAFAIPNAQDGVIITNGATWNYVGANSPNEISGNGTHGVVIQGSGTNANYIENNLIGSDSTGQKALGNNGDGVYVLGGASYDYVQNNLIVANGANGVSIQDPSTTGIQVTGNSIGVGNYGVNLGNGGDGVLLNDTTGNTVSGNYIYYNYDVGVWATNGAQYQNDYSNNTFYANVSGSIRNG
jgi:titin